MIKLAIANYRVHCLHAIFIRPPLYMIKLASCRVHSLHAVFIRPSLYMIKLAIAIYRVQSPCYLHLTPPTHST